MRDEQDVVGIFGFAGVVVNDSLVMIDFTDQKLRDSVPARTAIIEGEPYSTGRRATKQ